jgi:hypothetical protein
MTLSFGRFPASDAGRDTERVSDVTMAGNLNPRSRVTVDGKFFRWDGERILPQGSHLRSVRPERAGRTFRVTRANRDRFPAVRELGANLIGSTTRPPNGF